VESVELLNLNLAIEPDLQNFVCFLMESVKRLNGNAFRASLASLELSRSLRAAGACCGQPFPVSIQLQNHRLQVHWGETEFLVVQAGVVEQHLIEKLRDYLRKSTESTDPEILIQRNAVMARHLLETRARTEHELAELEVKLLSRQAALQVSIRQAETDPLTGLFNRRAFDERLNQAFRYTMRQKSSPLSLMMLDLDYFKGINDQHGHQYGDNYLINMAQILRSEIREDVDYAFRFGGDEFAIVIHADHIAAYDKAKQILHRMGFRVSIGISTIDMHTRNNLSLDEFIHLADSALYEAKHRGRGRAVVSQCSRGDMQVCTSICAVKEACV
jgi:two-component system cell cycle response regulator